MDMSLDQKPNTDRQAAWHMPIRRCKNVGTPLRETASSPTCAPLATSARAETESISTCVNVAKGLLPQCRHLRCLRSGECSYGQRERGGGKRAPTRLRRVAARTRDRFQHGLGLIISLGGENASPVGAAAGDRATTWLKSKSHNNLVDRLREYMKTLGNFETNEGGWYDRVNCTGPDSRLRRG